ncbi:MAG: hypothetical protein EBZ51_12230 [Synechococcaceae bacterium WB9_2_112]|nr:hypothetical protein [Synechococcaceae bacterium WB9_2_112]
MATIAPTRGKLPAHTSPANSRCRSDRRGEASTLLCSKGLPQPQHSRPRAALLIRREPQNPQAIAPDA